MASTSIITPRVRVAQRELILALTESTANTELSADQIQGRLSALISDIWNEVDRHVVVPKAEEEAECNEGEYTYESMAEKLEVTPDRVRQLIKDLGIQPKRTVPRGGFKRYIFTGGDLERLQIYCRHLEKGQGANEQEKQ